MNQSMLSANWNIHHRHRPDHAEFNSGILSGFEQLKNHPATNKTHLFHGRYENIYPDRAHFPQIEPLITWILAECTELLGLTGDLGISFWFNEMHSGDLTTLHTHNDDDELLSGVYYLRVPPGSGDIVFHIGKERKSYTPSEGDLFLFSPALPHEVLENRSGEVRLSMAFNVGRQKAET